MATTHKDASTPALPVRRQEVRLVVAGHAVRATQHEGALWLTAEQIGAVLGFKHPTNVMRIYRRNAAEFRPFVREAVLVLGHGIASVTCFAPRALVHFACLARTPKARAFRLALSERAESAAAKRVASVVAAEALTSTEDVLMDAFSRIEPLRDAVKGDVRAALTGVLDGIDEQLVVLDRAAKGGARAPGPSRGQRVDGMAALLRAAGGSR